jgi:hypothetical protein
MTVAGLRSSGQSCPARVYLLAAVNLEMPAAPRPPVVSGRAGQAAYQGEAAETEQQNPTTRVTGMKGTDGCRIVSKRQAQHHSTAISE